MRRHLNTLYITSEGAWLQKDGENVVIKVGGENNGRVPFHLLGGIVCMGAVGITPALMGHCAKNGICIAFLDRSGRFLARVEGPVSGNVFLRRNQYRLADDAKNTGLLVSYIVTGKLLNQRSVIRRALRDHGGNMPDELKHRLQACEHRLTNTARRSRKSVLTDSLRGIEGEAAQSYFQVFSVLVRNKDPVFEFKSRSRRPPLDPVNALLSFIYTLLLQDCRSALESVGLDPFVGFLHRDRPGRPSLALDLMEELRPIFADRLVLTLLNRKQLKPKDFKTSISGAVTMREKAIRKILIAYQDRKKDEILHPFLKEATTFGLIPHIQAKLLAQYVRGDIDGYPTFIWK